MKICILFVVLVVALGTAMGQEVEPEEQCTSAGGVCAKGCEYSPFNQGLCPNQQKDGVECCYPLVEKQCRSQGGSCGTCPPPLGRSDLGCPDETRCCIYL